MRKTRSEANKLKIAPLIEEESSDIEELNEQIVIQKKKTGKNKRKKKSQQKNKNSNKKVNKLVGKKRSFMRKQIYLKKMTLNS